MLNFRLIITKALKESSVISSCYAIVMSCVIFILKLFNRRTQKKILLVSYGGKQISDSPKRLYDLMSNDPFFKDYDFIWGVLDTKKFESLGYNVVKMDSLKYFVNCITSRIWITNSGIKRYTKVRGNKTLFINTWHGIPMKRIGKDEIGVKKTKLFGKKWEEFAAADINLCCTDYDLHILENVFNAPSSTMYRYGLPRNDTLYLADVTSGQLREKLNIPAKKKVILYAPTVRGNKVGKSGGNEFDVPLHPEKWARAFPDYVILFRAHYYVNEIDEEKTDNFIDVTSYPRLNDLMKLSDLLITDYSSLIFDYSILGKPIYCYAYDFEAYKEYQGFYDDNIQEKVPNFFQSENELINGIRHLDYQKEELKTRKFFNKYIQNSKGDSGERVVSQVKKVLMKEGD